MLCVDNPHTDPYFNLATEEYLLKNFKEDIFMLYQDEPSVIVGKHQNVRAEVNLKFAEANQLKVVRRFSGGGTVFHDLGNFNLTFIETGYSLNFDKFTQQMINLLNDLGINAKADERRALNVDGLKISGSAQCVHRDRVMYHATLLFSSDLDSLVTSLEADKKAYDSTSDKRVYVKSVKSPVTNILEHLEKPLDKTYFRQFVLDYFINKSPDNKRYKFSQKDISAIETLKDNKYATEQWNYDACCLKQ